MKDSDSWNFFFFCFLSSSLDICIIKKIQEGERAELMIFPTTFFWLFEFDDW